MVFVTSSDQGTVVIDPPLGLFDDGPYEGGG
jgi:hypothetical protein